MDIYTGRFCIKLSFLQFIAQPNQTMNQQHFLNIANPISQQIQQLETTFRRTCLSEGCSRAYSQAFLISLSARKYFNIDEQLSIKTQILRDEINRLAKRDSMHHKITSFIQERQELLRGLRQQLIGNRAQTQIPLSECCEKLSHLRMYSLNILEELGSLMKKLGLISCKYASEIVNKIMNDVNFFSSSQLRKHIQFSNTGDPLFLIPLKKFWNLQLNSNSHKKPVIQLFTIDEYYRARLVHADKLIKSVIGKQSTIKQITQKSPKQEVVQGERQQQTRRKNIYSSFHLPLINKNVTRELDLNKYLRNSISEIKDDHEDEEQPRRHRNKSIKKRVQTQALDYATSKEQKQVESLAPFKQNKSPIFYLDEDHNDEPQSSYGEQLTPTVNKPILIYKDKLHLQSGLNQFQVGPTYSNRSLEKNNKNQIVKKNTISKQSDNHKFGKRKAGNRAKSTFYDKFESLRYGESNQISKYVAEQRLNGEREEKDKIVRYKNPLDALKQIRYRKRQLQIKLAEYDEVPVEQQQQQQVVTYGDPPLLHKGNNKEDSFQQLFVFERQQASVVRSTALKKQPNLQITHNINDFVLLNSPKQAQKVEKTQQEVVDCSTRQKNETDRKKRLGFQNQYKIHTYTSAQNKESTFESKNHVQIESTQIIPLTKPVSPRLSKLQSAQLTGTFKQKFPINQCLLFSENPRIRMETTNRMTVIATEVNNKQDERKAISTQTADIMLNPNLVPGSAQAKVQNQLANNYQLKNRQLKKPGILHDKVLKIGNQLQFHFQSLRSGQNQAPTNLQDLNQSYSYSNIFDIKEQQKRKKQPQVQPKQQLSQIFSENSFIDTATVARSTYKPSFSNQQTSILKKCIFQSKPIENQDLNKLIKNLKSKKASKIIQYTQQQGNYFTNRHLIFSTCSLNDQIVCFCLSHPYLTMQQRYFFILHLEILQQKLEKIGSQLIYTFIKYLFYNDPTRNIIYLRIKGLFDENYSKYFEEIKVFSGEVKTPLKSRIFQEKSYLFERKTIKCNKPEDYTTIFNTIVLFISNSSDNTTITLPKQKKFYFSSSFLKRVQSSLKLKELKKFANINKLQSYLETQHLPQCKQCSLSGSLILYQMVSEDCLLNARFFIFAKYFYFTVQAPYCYFYEGKDAYFLLLATSFKNRYFLLADKIYEESEHVDLYKVFRQNIYGKGIGQVFKEDSLKGKIVGVPKFKKRVEGSLGENTNIVISFELNWKDYLKGGRYLKEQQVHVELIGPLLCSLVDVGDSGIKHLYSTIIDRADFQK